MSNGSIITPLIPDENIEVSKEPPEASKSPNYIYTLGNSPDNQKKEAPKLYDESCCKKGNCLQIIFIFFLLIIIFSIITSIIIQCVYVKIFPIVTFFYGISTFIVLAIFYIEEDKCKKIANLFVSVLFWDLDTFVFYGSKDYYKIKEKNEFIANCLKYSKFGEISIWVLIIYLEACADFDYNNYS